MLKIRHRNFSHKILWQSTDLHTSTSPKKVLKLHFHSFAHGDFREHRSQMTGIIFLANCYSNQYLYCTEANKYFHLLFFNNHSLTKPNICAKFKVTIHLQGCLACKRCSASGLNCSYLNAYIKLKLIGLAITLYQKFWKKVNCRIFHDS